jgi:hypothetical protein
MWICTNRSFLSIVHKHPCKADELLVRARVRAHITAAFPKAKIQRNENSDYLFRAVVKRSEVAAVIAQQIESINYGNFKNTVRNGPLHNAYHAIWHVMAKLQPLAPYSGRWRGRGTKPLFQELAQPVDGEEEELPRRRHGEMTDAEWAEYERQMAGA